MVNRIDGEMWLHGGNNQLFFMHVHLRRFDMYMSVFDVYRYYVPSLKYDLYFENQTTVKVYYNEKIKLNRW